MSIVLSPVEVERVRDRLTRFAWYRAAFERFRERVDELLVRSPGIPVLKGRAFFESCPDDNARLTFDPYAPTSHRCRKCGRDWQGEEFDLAWVRQFQEWLGQRLVEAGILYRVEGEERYAKLVRDSLAHFVEHYREYPLANNLLGPTRLFQSTYLEAFWLVDMVAAFDLTRSSTAYSEADHSGLRDLFYESAAVVRSYDEGISNRQAFNNAGMGAVALLYDDEELLEHVLAGPHGFAFHMRESLLEDGIWYEGETYHFATLDHSLNLAEMARRRGIDLYTGESGYGSLRPMFDGPLKVMLPDLTFPSRKDSWFGRGIGYHRDVYELGFARYDEQRYGGLLSHAYSNGEANRSDLTWRTFLNLEPELPQVTSDESPRPGFLSLSDLRPKECERMPGTGVAILRRDGGSVYAGLEYGHYGGGHGHPDRLHLTLFADGVHWFLDPGTGWYHVPELGWYRSTLAHNTVSIDGKLQNPREGRLLAFGEAGGYQVVQSLVEDVAEGVDLRRTLCLGDGFLLDVVDAWSEDGREHTFDLALHTPEEIAAPDPAGPTSGEPPVSPTPPPTPPPNQGATSPTAATAFSEASFASLGDRDGYEFLREAAPLPAGALDATLRSNDSTLRLVQLGPAERYRARAPGIPLNEERPMSSLFTRRQETRARFATLYLWGEGHTGTAFSEERGEYLITGGNSRHRVLIDEEPGVAVAYAHVCEEGDDTHAPVRNEGDNTHAPVREEGDNTHAHVCVATRGVAVFGRSRARLGEIELESDRPLEVAAFTRNEDGWNAELPEEFGAIRLEGLEATGIGGMPAGARASLREGCLRLEQRPATYLWTGAELPLTLFAGCHNAIELNVASYGSSSSDLPVPTPSLPVGWRLVSLDRASGDAGDPVQKWRLVVEVPSSPEDLEGTLVFDLRDGEQPVSYRLKAPLAASWRVQSEAGQPVLRLDVRDERGSGGRVDVEIDAPWWDERMSRSLTLAPNERSAVSFPLPTSAPATPGAVSSASSPWASSGIWELGGHNASGDYRVAARIRCEGFIGVSRASLPLYWSGGPEREPARIELGREDQALWADRRWRDPQDASARAEVSWDSSGLRLVCRVTDDLHVTDANRDDLYENDSLQVYFDFRRDHHGDRNFAPGVAAYVLAADEDRKSVRVKEIAGNREISNRGARAGWFTTEGISASAQPTEGGYLLEAFFPYRSLGVEPLEAGQVIGFDLSLSDNDGTWYRNTQLLWSGARGRRCYIRGSYHDPREFGWLIAAEPE